VGGSAAAGVDYSSLPNAITFGAGQTSASFSVVPLLGGSGLKQVRMELVTTPYTTQFLVGPRFQSVVTIQ
jgi:hypothetical protein